MVTLKASDDAAADDTKETSDEKDADKTEEGK